MFLNRSKTFIFMLTSVLVLVASGCSSSQVYNPDANIIRRMPPAKASKMLHDMVFDYNKKRPLVLHGSKTYVVKDIKVINYKQLVFVLKNHNDVEFTLKDIIEDTSLENGMGVITISYHGNKYMLLRESSFWDSVRDGYLTADDAKNISSAIYVLKNVAIDEDQYESYFNKVVIRSHTPTAKSALTEDARKYKVQAEIAVREKSYAEAGDLYREALKIAPWWAEGHFNRALVLSEIGEYDLAIVEMKRYLLLSPNAPDARAAQDKIYDWDRKAKMQ